MWPVYQLAFEHSLRRIHVYKRIWFDVVRRRRRC